MDVGEKRLAQQQDTNEGEKLSTEPPATTVGATTVSESQDNPGDKVPSQKRVRPNEDEAASNAPTAEQPDAKGERLHRLLRKRHDSHTDVNIQKIPRRRMHTQRRVFIQALMIRSMQAD